MFTYRQVTISLWICFAAHCASAVEPYIPVQSSPLLESWRWHVQEALEGFSLSRGVEAADGSLWFISDTGLVHYDGLSTSAFPAPEGLDVLYSRGMMMSWEGSIYMLFPGKIVQFKESIWTVIYEFPGRYSMVYANAVHTPDDTILFGTPDGIVAVKDGKARVISSFNKRITYLLLDSRNNLWVNRLGSGTVYRYPDFSAEEPVLNDNWVSYHPFPENVDHTAFIEAPDGDIWFTTIDTQFDVRRLNPKLNQWSESTIDDSSEKVHRSIHLASDGTIFVYGDKRILVIKDGRTTEMLMPDYDFPITRPFVVNLRSGNLIIGGRRETVYMVDYSTRVWESFQGLNYFCSDPQQRQWFISFEGNIVVRDPDTGIWLSYNETDAVIDTPLAMICSTDGKVWAAGQHENIAAISVFEDGKWTSFMHPELGQRISHQSILETSDGIVLFGSGDQRTYEPSAPGGLLKYEVNGDHYTVTHFAPPRVPRRIVGLEEGPDGTIWAGGSLLHKMDNFKAEALPQLGSLNNSWIDDFTFTDSGDLWVALWGVGLEVYDGETWKYSGDQNNSLPNRVVALHSDRNHKDQVWVATAMGLYNVDANCWVDTPFAEALSVMREGSSIYQSPDGKLWINSSSRNWNFRDSGDLPDEDRFGKSFYTVSFNRYDTTPETEIIDFKATVSEPGMNQFKWRGSCEWSLASSQELSYSYRVDDGEWTEFSKLTEILLESLSNGRHAFEVRARTPFGNVDPTPARVEFTVIPVLWKQPWFLITLMLFISLLIALVAIIIRQRIKHLLALEEYKLQFFTNISHELRTPLMVIMGPLEALRQSVDEKGKKHLDLAYRNARKLVSLVDKLLDFRKAALGKIQAHPKNLDLVLFIRQEIAVLNPMAEQKDQTLEFQSDKQSLLVFVDAKIVEIILDNLISNAIKYTPQKGTISVHLETTNEDGNQVVVRIEVEDTGPGIESKELEKVFDPFYQTSNSYESNKQSTGIGLSHTKSVVEAVGGKIYAQSPVSSDSGRSFGSRFVVEMAVPLAKTSKTESSVRTLKSVNDEEMDVDEEIADIQAKPVLLIVEDDDDIMEYLLHEFKPSYEVVSAQNGQDGLTIAQERIPDIIISDVLMPKMDGKDMCKRIKSDQRTSHVPVVLLTALKSEVHQLAGLETGADDYIAKPVNIALLKFKIENLLQNRARMREFISRQAMSIVINKEELPVNHLDREFIAKLMETIDANLTNETFDVDGLAELMHMSRMTLYRKVKALTGHSPGNIVRSIRLKKAAQYLETGSWNVSQVIEKVGFWDMSHFARAFKKEFGCTPTQYIDKFKNNLTE